MTTLADAVAAPLAVWVGFRPFRRRIEFAPLTLADAGAYERNARQRGGQPNDGRLLCFLAARRANPLLTWRRFRWQTFGHLARCMAAVRLVNVRLFLRVHKEDKKGGDSAVIDAGNIWRRYILMGWAPDVIARMTTEQLAMYDKEDTDGKPTVPPPQWESVEEWRAAKKADGTYEALRGKGAT